MKDRPRARAVVRLGQAAFRLRGPCAEEPTGKLLHAVLIGMMCWVVIQAGIIIPFFSEKKVSSAALTLFAASVSAASLWLLYRGSLRAASLAFIFGIWAYATILILLDGGIRSSALVLYIPLPILAAWLLGFRAALWSAWTCIGVSLILAILGQSGIVFPRYFAGAPFAVWTLMVASTILAAVPVSRILQVLNAALAQSQAAEEALRQQQESLEEVVQQRTAELVEARDQAQSASRAKTAFVANMSHELRTPLTAILGFSMLLREETGLNEEQRRDLDIINRGGRHLLRMIDGVLDIARIEAGGSTVENTVVDLESLVYDTVELMQAHAREKHLELVSQYSPAVPRFACTDGSKLRQMLVNLIGNAIKFTQEGSVTLRVDAGHGRDPNAFKLQIAIEDTGIGIADQDQARIFEPFVQAESTHRKNGTGLGLAITRQFVELMGGSIELRSSLGKGSCFRIELPLKAAQEPRYSGEPDFRTVVGVAPDQPDYRILIVEDEPENWRLLKRMLQDVGFRVRVAENGEQAITLFSAWRPDFIWLDLRLPDMDGMQLAQRIRSLEGGPMVKMAAITAHVFSEQREIVLAAGLDDLVHKPYGPAEVFLCMARHLGIRYLHRDSGSPAEVESPPVNTEALAVVPERLREDLASALLALDVGQVSQVIDRISDVHPAVGEALRRSADRFAYTYLVRTLEACNGPAAKEKA